MTRVMTKVVLGLMIVALAGVAWADEKASPTGTWKSKYEVNGQTRETTFKLKLDGDKLTGTMVGRDNKEIAIEEATFKDGEISFKVTRERNGQKSTTKYTGKLDGDTIKGKAESERNGQPQSRDFEAKRSKD